MMIEPLAECLVDQLLTEILNHRNGAIVDDYNTRTVVHSLVFAEEYKKNYLEVVMRQYSVCHESDLVFKVYILELHVQYCM